MKEQIFLGQWTQKELDTLLNATSSIEDIGKRIDLLSGSFLGAAYKESTLTGDVKTPEIFVINFSEVDCFTFLDYIEALRISKSFAALKENLKKIRYRSEMIAYENRNHFFTDWREYNSDLVKDITEYIVAGKSSQAIKILNQKDDGTCFLTGISCRERQIVYIPAGNVDNAVIENMRTGDYIGIYSEKPGLDVSHVGILIKNKEDVFFRHASKSRMRVVDEDFRNYISGKPGIVVLRPM
jgi:hypothetical protein